LQGVEIHYTGRAISGRGHFMDPVVGFEQWAHQWMQDPVHCAILFGAITVIAVVMYKMSIRPYAPGEKIGGNDTD